MPSSSRGFHPPPPNQPPPHYPAYYDPNIPLSTVAASVLIGVVLVYQLLSGFLALPSPLDAIALMAGLLFGPSAREHLQATFATSPRQVVSQVRNRAASIVGGGARAPVDTSGGTVGGLWNVGNTCYQNSVLQALASLENLTAWLQAIEDGTAAEALERMLEDLNTVKETPRAMMASSLITHASGGAKGWMFNEQQDAQEFLQGLMGVLEREVGKVVAKRKAEKALGLEALVSEGDAKPTELDPSLRSPFEGLLAQRVGCLECKYVESISLQPFTTLSLPIPSTSATTLESCLRAFTAIENIPQVDCDKCTLLAVQSRLQGLLQPTADPEVGELPAEHRETIKTRLRAVNAALEDDNFTPKIPGVKLTGAHKVSSTKTKQVKIARTPLLLVLHTNRSQFDILTGTVGKNYAAIKFPYVLDLGATGAVTSYETLSMDLGTPMSSAGNGECVYELKAVVSHYGGHHNGHYVSYRRWAKKWWRISDHEVMYVPYIARAFCSLC
jgi:ubiquitin carboxyl-terminal hydrolase 1